MVIVTTILVMLHHQLGLQTVLIHSMMLYTSECTVSEMLCSLKPELCVNFRLFIEDKVLTI